jgi:hypothetical protein
MSAVSGAYRFMLRQLSLMGITSIVGALAMLVYDYFLTLDDEVRILPS